MMNKRVLVLSLLLAATAYAGVVVRSNDSEGPNQGETCTSVGKFPVPGRCQDYYQCQYLSESTTFNQQTFSCPEGDIFDTSISDCREASLVTSHINCQEDEVLEDLGVSKKMADVINDSEVVCQRIRNIDSYDTTVISTLSLRKSFDYMEKFNGYITDYNQDLKTAQAHMGVWRKGKDIKTEIKTIYELAKEYETEFNRKYEINKGRVTTVGATSDTQIENLNEDIRKLNADIQSKLEDMATQVPEVKSLLEGEVTRMRARLATKEAKLKDSTPAGLELKELVAFVGFVKRDADRVLDRAVASRKRIEELHNNVLNDKDTFLGYIGNITRDNESLETEKQQHQKNKKDKQMELENLEKDKAQLQAKVDDLNKMFDDIGKDIEKNRKKYNKKKHIICKVGGPYESACETALSVFAGVYGLDTLNQEMDDFNKQRSELLTEIDMLLPQFADFNKNITQLRNSLPTFRSKIDEIKSEIQEFNRFLPDVEKMLQSIDEVLPDIQDTANGLQKVEYAFQGISEDLDGMIDIANRAEQETEKQNAKEQITEGLASLQKQLSQSSEKINDVEQTCRRYA